MKKIFYALVVLAVAGFSGTAQANVGQMIDIDVQGSTQVGHGPILTNGSDFYLYSISSATGETKLIPLVESSGSYSLVNFSYTANASTAISGIGGSSAMQGSPYANLFDGYMTATETKNISFTGLDQNKTYELVVYAQVEAPTGGGTVNHETRLSINGTQVLYSANSTSDHLIQGVNYAIINGLTSDAHGNLSLSYLGNISGLQLKEVPEPASMVLLGIGGILFGLRRKNFSANSVPAV